MDIEVKRELDILFNQNLEILAMLRLLCPAMQGDDLFTISRNRELARNAKREARENAIRRRD